MARFTRALRQRIIEDFTRANNGWFDPRAFVAHVRAAGPEHPAFGWFEWDDKVAAEAHRLDQARDFVRGLVVRFEVRTEAREGLTVVAREAPFAVSPVAPRRSGGGYYLTEPGCPEQMAELRRQAARDLAWWLRRYRGAVEDAGVELGALDDLPALLMGEAAEAA